ncbi:hypothetical protein AVM11_09690 [Sphingomonas melonis TY]|jgi:uncharacterized protein involved in exopolysaccharide biosynthesis|uniref:Polysaccharide chain length determinant N-terminal domain-containing protein n=1 Tax=Sphingomonas melonis TY TaxID=621456 RepID=A0A175XZQ4_9SPHN|nr:MULTISPECIES: hypothetical protein [Sphingomonas]AOW25366.1 hypothetical protein BJP26_18980 [Sphingomonas melonis TY]ATI54233.1 hypothetical protein CP552_00490 [Sphingomonas melonis]KZB93917.1 hypothetical protein AVM11_09690 [Sphingomonas melonis TY]MBI0532091.1 hypothetical protein [Sphingomonas sp. TX0522]MBX8846259.1 hypothetical protein [Sphingomonas melonis]
MLDFTSSSEQQETETRHGQFALRDLLNGIFYYRRLALIVAGSIIGLGILVALLLPPSYSAEARLLPLSAGIYDMQDAGRAPLPGQVLDPGAVANVELQMLDSLELHRDVVRAQLGPAASPAEINAALEKFQSHLHVTKANEANVIQLTYTARDPQQAADALRQLIRRYFESRATVLTSGRVAFLEQQRNAIKRQLDEASARITAYQQQNGIVDIAAQVAGAVAQDDLLRKSKLESDAELADGRRSLSSLSSQAKSVPADIRLYNDNTEAARALGEMQAQLLGLQAKRADLASRFMATSPQVTQLDKQIAALQATITQQKSSLVMTQRTGRNQYFDSTKDKLIQSRATVAGAEARGAELAGQLGQSRARLAQLNAISDRLTTMKLDRDVLADSFKSLSSQVEQARVQLNQTTEAGSPNVRVIEAPTPPTKRTNPPLLLIAGSIFAGILIAGAAVFIAGSLRETFLTPVEVERALGLPVLAAPVAEQGEGVARDYSRLIAAVDAHHQGSGRAVLLVAPSSRMSLQTAALGLGRAMARRAGARVLLVRFASDAPVPETAASLELEPFEDMMTTIIGTAACSLQRRDVRLLAELRERFDYIVVTAPPMAVGYEGIELSQAVDVVVPVVEAEATRRPVARTLVTQLRDAGAVLIGAILLGRRWHIPQRLYRLLIERRA